ncbi:MAG: outer membrane protein assembly factor BamA [Alphaproteobacteria bacterium]
MRNVGLLIAALSLSLAALFASPASAQQQRQPPAQRAVVITQIVIEGNNRVEIDTIVSYMTVKVGDPADPAKLDESLKRLFDTGLFQDVNLRRDGTTVIVKVIEHPIINRLAFEGNKKLKDTDFQTEIELRPRSVYTRARVQAAVRRMLDMYRATGRFGATVTPKIIQLPQNRVDLVFEINEGELTSIQRISFIGNKSFSDSDLKEEIQTKESAWYRFFSTSDIYDPDRLNFDRELLRKFFLSKGFADFRVVSVTAALSPDRTGFYIAFVLDEGERYRFGAVDVTTGIKGLDAAKLKRRVAYGAGDRYNADKVENSINALVDGANAQGIPFVDVRPVTKRAPDKKEIAITFEVREGQRLFVERIEIQGNTRTRDEVIRRELRFTEGDPFNAAKVRISRRRLDNLQFFEKVDITNRPGSAPDKTIVVVKVSEKSTGELSLGGGFSTQDGLLGAISVRERNFMGRGQEVGLAFTISQRSNEIDFRFTEPYFLNRNVAAGFDIFRVSRQLDDEGSFITRSTGFRLRFGWQYTDEISQLVRYEFFNTSIRNIADTASPYIKAEEGNSTTSAIGTEFVYDTRDRRFEPTDGWFISPGVRFAGLGGSEFFIKPSIRAGYYYSVFPGWVVSVQAEAGYSKALGNGYVRLNERYFIGGDNLRGFRFGGVGPRDVTTNDALGANQYYSVAVELNFPLGLPKEWGITGRVFTDIGAAWGFDVPRLNGVLDSANPRISAGVGFSWVSPFGPIKVDFGIPLMKESFDKTQVFNFRFGTRF